MAVQEGPSFKRYAANGIATVYSIPFLLLDDEDLVVTLDGVEVTSGFTLSGIGSPTSSATFDVAPTGDLLFLLVIPFQRLADYQLNGDFLASTVNNDFDRIWLALKELRRDDQRALSVNPLEPEGIPPLPVADLRQLRVLAFDADGDPVPSNLTLAQIEEQPALALASAAAAQASAEAAALSETAAGGYANAASSSAGAAGTAATLASKWADEAEDVPVATGPNRFSAMHWALKAAASLASLAARVLALENIGKPFTKEYVSPEQTITVGGQLVIAHGLAAVPKLVTLELVCKSAEAGYSVGMVLNTHIFADNGSANDGMSVVRDATNLTLRFGSSGGLPILNYTSGATVRISPSLWKLVARAWA